MSTPSDDISLFGVLSETRRILKANRFHFSILSLLFLLPLYISLIIYITIFPIGSTQRVTFVQILYIVAYSVLSLFGISTITYSAFNGYYNRPLELIATLKSLASSFFPLVSTLVVTQLTYYSVFCLIGIVGAVMYICLESLTCVVVVVLIMYVWVIYIQMKWIMSNVVVVVESKWGYEPLRRSAYLIKGVRRVALKMIAFFGVLIFTCIYAYYWCSTKTDTTGGFWQYLFAMVAVSCLMTVLAEYNLTAIVVLYIYSMKIHGELAMEIQPEEYVSLLIDEDGNKSVAAVVHA